MIDFQTLNQLFLTILALMLASLFVGSMSMNQTVGSATMAKYWRLSLGARCLSYLLWAALPIAGPLCGAGANMLFIFSAGCLALLFRSWRTEIHRELFWLVVIAALLVGGLHLVVQRMEGSYAMRLIVTGSAGILFSAWELVELIKRARKDREPLLKVIIGFVLLQKLLAIATLMATLHYNGSDHRFLTDNATKSIYATWCVLSIHLAIYLLIGSYLYRKAIQSQRSAVSENDQLKTLVDEREKLLASLIATNRITSSGALSASLARELNQPLTAALMQLGLMKHIIVSKKDADPTLVDLLDNALKEIAQPRLILENVRAVFRQRPHHRQPCDVGQLVEQTALTVQKRLQGARVRLICPEGVSISAEIAEIEIQQVLINLLNNAIDSLSRTTGRMKTIWIDVHDKGEHVVISISDNGPGVPPELVDEIFELDQSDSASDSRIGLWISKYIVEDRHRGRLWLDSLYAPGARFVMELPKHATVISGSDEPTQAARLTARSIA